MSLWCLPLEFVDILVSVHPKCIDIIRIHVFLENFFLVCEFLFEKSVRDYVENSVNEISDGGPFSKWESSCDSMVYLSDAIDVHKYILGGSYDVHI